MSGCFAYSLQGQRDLFWSTEEVNFINGDICSKNNLPNALNIEHIKQRKKKHIEHLRNLQGKQQLRAKTFLLFQGFCNEYADFVCIPAQSKKTKPDLLSENNLRIGLSCLN